MSALSVIEENEAEISDSILSELNDLLLDDIVEEEEIVKNEIDEFTLDVQVIGESDVQSIQEEKTEIIEEDEIDLENIAKMLENEEESEELLLSSIVDEIETELENEKLEPKEAAPTPVKKEPRPRVKIRSFESREEILKQKANPEFYLLEKSDLELDEEGQKAKHDEVVQKIKDMNVKVGAKCINMLSALNSKGNLSTFVKSGLFYIYNTKTITNADFVYYFMDMKRNKTKPYSKGTAMPQATNLLKLFTELKMLKKDGNKYVLNEESLLNELAKGVSE